MRLGERIGDLEGVLNRPVDGKRPFPEMLGKGLSFEVLHHEKVDAVLVSDVVEGADVRMLKRGDGARFALEPLTEIGVGGERSGQDLDGDEAIEPDVAGLVDLAHAAGSQRAQDFIRTEANAGSQTHGRLHHADWRDRRQYRSARWRAGSSGRWLPGRAWCLTTSGGPSRLQISISPTFGRRVAEHP